MTRISGFIAAFLLAFILNHSLVRGKIDDSPISDRDLSQVIESVDLDKGFSFAGEEMPDNFDNRERLDRELSVNAYWHSSTLLNLKTAHRYFTVIEKILKEQGIPEDFKYMAVAESNLRHVTSPAMAKGFWQLRDPVAEDLGLEINSEVDERFHIEKATEAACKYLRQLHSRFGNWTNAAAAYNVGPTNFSRTLKEQGQESFYELNMNEETNRYLFRLIAMKEILSHPEKYGFYLDDDDKYPPLDDYYEVTVDGSIESWGAFASKYGISYRMLKVYNPWLLDHKLTVINNVYQVRIPKSSMD